MQASLIDIAEDTMPLNDTDKAWIREEIRNAHKTHGMGRITRFIKEWSGTGAVVAILILVLTQYTGYVEFRTHTGDTLLSLDKRMTNIEGQIAKQTTVTQAALPQSEFQAGLPDLSSALATMRKQNLTVATPVADSIQEKLLQTSPTIRGYWPAAGEFITYRSQAVLGRESAGLPPCVLQGVSMRTTAPVNAGTNVTVPHGPVEYHYCSIVLDSPEGIDLLSHALSFADVVFDHCAVIYSGGPLAFIPMKVSENSPAKILGKQISFANCYFYLSLKAVPPPAGQELTTNLLTATAGTITLETRTS